MKANRIKTDWKATHIRLGISVQEGGVEDTRGCLCQNCMLPNAKCDPD
jgi:hypothetical protein